jgi:hypothetical protein
MPGKAAFGADSHPAALLDLSRANADSAAWWQRQLLALSPGIGRTNAQKELALAEWLLALWCVADPI